MIQQAFGYVDLEEILEKIPGKKYLVEFDDGGNILQRVNYTPYENCEITLKNHNTKVGISVDSAVTLDEDIIYYWKESEKLNAGDSFSLEYKKECPVCEGTGVIRDLKEIAFKGDYHWVEEECPNCEGTGKVEVK